MKEQINLFHLEDNPFEQDSVKDILRGSGIRLTQFFCPSELFAAVRADPSVDVLLLDMDLGADMTGLDCARKICKIKPDTMVIILSNNAKNIVSDPKVFDCVFDIISKDELDNDLVERLVHNHSKWQAAKNSTIDDESTVNFVGSSMAKISTRLENIIDSEIGNIIVSGETGTGKEVVADILESKLSATVPFVRLNCAAIQHDLFLSELFGHKKGSFTGAHCDRGGLLESANGGWLFLDECNSLSIESQGALLRFLETGEARKVGSDVAQRYRVKLVAATNTCLKAAVAMGRFRADLYQRLKEAEITLLPLRDRRKEIPELVRHLVSQFKPGHYKIPPLTVKMLSNYDWSEGNIRELRNCLRAMTEHERGGWLTPSTIPRKILSPPEPLDEPHSDNESLTINWQKNTTVAYSELCTQLLNQLVNKYRTEKNLSDRQIAKAIGISRNTISRRLAPSKV